MRQSASELEQSAHALAETLSARVLATKWLANTGQPLDEVAPEKLGLPFERVTRRAYIADVMKKRHFAQRAAMANETLDAYRRIAWYDTKKVSRVEGPIEDLLRSAHVDELARMARELLGEQDYLLIHDLSSFLRESCCALVSDPPTFFRAIFPVYELGHAPGSWRGMWPEGVLNVW